MNKVLPVFEWTVKLVELLENGTVQDRDEKIRQINDYLEKRETAMANLVPPYTDEERKLGIRIVELNKQLTALLEREKSSIQQDLKTLFAKKASNQRYVNPYQSLMTGGVFYDKRK